MKRFTLYLLAFVVVTVGSSGTVLAQTSKGFVAGTIEDQNGAAIANATVKITNLKTGATRETVADSSGSFRLEAVDPGEYSLDATGAGFKTAKLDKIEVNAAQTATVAVRLEVGNPTEEVVISASNEVVVQNSDGARVNTLGEREIRDLPPY